MSKPDQSIKQCSVVSYSVEDTCHIGFLCGKQARAGNLIALSGDLGAGKTVFTKGIARGLGYSGWERLKSPTFTIVHEYKSRPPLYHFDLYRLNDYDELFEIGFEEYLAGRGVVVVEWADKFDAVLPQATIRVAIAHRTVEMRTISIEGPEKMVDQIIEYGEKAG